MDACPSPGRSSKKRRTVLETETPHCALRWRWAPLYLLTSWSAWERPMMEMLIGVVVMVLLVVVLGPGLWSSSLSLRKEEDARRKRDAQREKDEAQKQ
jgi:uncharacterized protein (DUF2062 family)